MKKISVFILIVTLLTSCEPSYNYSYTVANNSDTTVEVHIQTFRTDTIYSIIKDSQEIVYITDHGIEGWNGPYFQNVNIDLDSFTVTKNGMNSTRNYLENKNWNFENGKYKTVVTNNDF